MLQSALAGYSTPRLFSDRQLIGARHVLLHNVVKWQLHHLLPQMTTENILAIILVLEDLSQLARLTGH